MLFWAVVKIMCLAIVTLSLFGLALQNRQLRAQAKRKHELMVCGVHVDLDAAIVEGVILQLRARGVRPTKIGQCNLVGGSLKLTGWTFTSNVRTDSFCASGRRSPMRWLS